MTTKMKDLCGLAPEDAIDFDEHRASDDGMPEYDGNEDDLGVKWGPASSLSDKPAYKGVDYGVGNYSDEIEAEVVASAIRTIQASIGHSDTSRWVLIQYDVVEIPGEANGGAKIVGTRITGTISDEAIVQTAMTLSINYFDNAAAAEAADNSLTVQ